jgi:simple sugar transport system ATP-binding protein
VRHLPLFRASVGAFFVGTCLEQGKSPCASSIAPLDGAFLAGTTHSHALDNDHHSTADPIRVARIMLDPSPSNDMLVREPLVRAIGITKRYGTLLANDAIDLDLYPEEIHALLGENGAGKSTFVKIMYGLIQPSRGDLRWMGRKLDLAGPADARALGIGMVFQHFSLFENLTVAENVALGLAPTESFAAISARLAEVSQLYGLLLDPKREVWRLSVGERQRVEIVRALMQDPKLLILDEPTAVLTPREANQLFIVLERLRSEGRAILYISHKLEEVKRLCDRATILRGGKKVATCDPRRETAASLARMMVGGEIGEVKAGSGRATSAARLIVRGLTLEADDPHGVRLEEVCVEVKGGEILGIAGVAGNGQDELFAALSGERLAPSSGSVVIDGQAAGHLSVTERRKRGAAFVPEERLGHGTAPRMKLSDNALLTGHAASGMVNHGFIDKTATLAAVDRTTSAFDVRKAKRDPEAASLSGGNLQKFIVGREILREPGVLVVSQPTWGVDAGAAATIRQALIDLAARGTAVLVVSQDLDELAEIADRIAVMFHGRLSVPLMRAEASREKLGLLMGGSSATLQEMSYAAGA